AVSRGNLDAAGPATFFDLPYASYAFDLIAGPDNWRLAVAAPGDRGIVCGAIDPREGGDEQRSQPRPGRARERAVAGAAPVGRRAAEAPARRGRDADREHPVVARD